MNLYDAIWTKKFFKLCVIKSGTVKCIKYCTVQCTYYTHSRRQRLSPSV